MAKILEGKPISLEIRSEISAKVEKYRSKYKTVPGLAAVLVGDNPASQIYVRNKQKACSEAGMFSETFKLDKDTSEGALIDLIKQLNGDSKFHGILVQLPLPKQISVDKAIEALDPSKDIDCLHPFNVGKLVQGDPVFLPVTPAGIQQILIRNGYSPSGKHMVICGRSNIVGKPLSIMMMQKNPNANSTVTICHTSTLKMEEVTKTADILVAATGMPNSITEDMVKEGAIVIDVGINRIPDPSTQKGYRLVGDVDFEAVSRKAEAITPVPGGVGPMTIAMLLANTMLAAEIGLSKH